MSRILGLIAILVLTALPASAQDTSAVGRQGEGIETNADPNQAQPPDANPNVTTREGVEGQKAGQENQTDIGKEETGVTNRAAQTTERETTTPTTPTTPTTDTEMTDTDTDTDMTGGEMPTTASPLPLVVLAGSLLLLVGLGLRVFSRQS